MPLDEFEWEGAADMDINDDDPEDGDEEEDE